MKTKCSHANDCEISDACLHGTAHDPNPDHDASTRCFDHKPYINGGVVVWGEPVDQPITISELARQDPREGFSDCEKPPR